MTARAWRRVGLAIAIAIAALLFYWDPRAEPAARSPAPPEPELAPAAPESPAPTSIAPPPRSQPHAPTPACRPRADTACERGDVYWFDDCGAPGELAESCEGRGCKEGRCQAPAAAVDACGKVTAYGECAGDVAQACIDHNLVTFDCASKNQRCVMTSEGAACLPRDDKLACDGSARPSCSGTQLRLCVDGRFRSLDCAAHKAVCNEDAAGAHCGASPLPAAAPAPASELCDGKDNDDDGKIDEGGACEPIPLVAFIPDGARLINLEPRMADELAILNRVYAPTVFRWAKTVAVSASLRVFDPADLEALAPRLAQSESSFYKARNPPPTAAGSSDRGFDFYVAVLFTERLKLDPPKSGVSTLPNARCGGVRLSDAPSPVSGLIVLSEARQPETLTHELGHYLGLCHTHEQLADFIASAADVPWCERSGDSICDTPDDPGPPQCFQEAPCELACTRQAHPDPFNIMSYYIGCRRTLTPEQLAETARNLSLRRGWFRCQDPRDCPCDPRAKNACPMEMSCEPIQHGDAGWLCELDGAFSPGAPCRGANDCSARAFCLGPVHDKSAARCVRPCDDEPGCSCLEVGLELRVCAEDLN